MHLAKGGDSVRFVLPVRQGRVGLYAYSDNAGLLLLPQEGETLYELSEANWHLQLTRFLQGSPLINMSQRQLQEMGLSAMHVERLTQPSCSTSSRLTSPCGAAR